MKKLLPLVFLLLSSCAATRPVGEAFLGAANKVGVVSATPFLKVVDHEPRFHPVVEYPLMAGTLPLAFAGAAVGAVIMVPGILLTPTDYTR